MYLYTDFDQQLINQRVAQFRDQTERYLAGKLTEDEYRPLRLQNGLYVQRYAPMLRIAVPYGLMNTKQLRKIAEIATQYDRGYAHVSTRQNIQLNWPALENVPDILAELATVQMHAVQTSGNCIRNTTTDQFAGVVAGEIADPRPTCELIRQWSTFHPEFAFLPRKFKIAVSALEEKDRAATAFHDIGVYIVRNDAGEIGYKIMAGGGLGRTPIIGSVIREFLPREDLIAYLEATLRVYNLHGRRDNKYKARIKILVKALTPEVFAQKVEAEFEHTRIFRSENQRNPGFFIVFHTRGIYQCLHFHRGVRLNIQSVLVTEGHHRDSSAQSVFSVHLVIQVAQICQALLEILHRLPLAAPLETGKVIGGRIVRRRTVPIVIIVRCRSGSRYGGRFFCRFGCYNIPDPFQYIQINADFLTAQHFVILVDEFQCGIEYTG